MGTMVGMPLDPPVSPTTAIDGGRNDSRRLCLQTVLIELCLGSRALMMTVSIEVSCHGFDYLLFTFSVVMSDVKGCVW